MLQCMNHAKHSITYMSALKGDSQLPAKVYHSYTGGNTDGLDDSNKMKKVKCVKINQQGETDMFSI